MFGLLAVAICGTRAEFHDEMTGNQELKQFIDSASVAEALLCTSTCPNIDEFLEALVAGNFGTATEVASQIPLDHSCLNCQHENAQKLIVETMSCTRTSPPSDECIDIFQSLLFHSGNAGPAHVRKILNHCHPADATVEALNGHHIRIDAIKVGDSIKTPHGYEKVSGFLHTDAKSWGDYIVFETEEGRKMAITPLHAMFINGKEMRPADAQLGDFITTSEGTQDKIVAIHAQNLKGLYHLIVPSGAYYVDGVLASTYVYDTVPKAVWRVFMDGYVSLRYSMGIPTTPIDQCEYDWSKIISLYDAAGIPTSVQKNVLFPFSILYAVVADALSTLHNSQVVHQSQRIVFGQGIGKFSEL